MKICVILNSVNRKCILCISSILSIHSVSSIIIIYASRGKLLQYKFFMGSCLLEFYCIWIVNLHNMKIYCGQKNHNWSKHIGDRRNSVNSVIQELCRSISKALHVCLDFLALTHCLVTFRLRPEDLEKVLVAIHFSYVAVLSLVVLIPSCKLGNFGKICSDVKLYF